MRHLRVLDTSQALEERVKTGLRASICRNCPARSAGSELLSPDQVRKCEEKCELFQSVGWLLHLAHFVDPMVGKFDRVMTGHLKELARHGIACQASPKGHKGLKPWSRQTRRIVNILRNMTRS